MCRYCLAQLRKITDQFPDALMTHGLSTYSSSASYRDKCEGTEWIHLAQDGPVTGSFVRGSKLPAP
jgi:hypothetical protein